MTAKPRVLLVSIVSPKNDCGVRILMYRQLVERSPFELHVVSRADFTDEGLVHTPAAVAVPYASVKKEPVGSMFGSMDHRLRKPCMAADD
jgi:hypothetical protein